MINNKKKSSSRGSTSSRYITTEHLFKSKKLLNRYQFVNFVVDLAKRKMQSMKDDGHAIDSSYILDDVFLDLEAGVE